MSSSPIYNALADDAFDGNHGALCIADFEGVVSEAELRQLAVHELLTAVLVDALAAALAHGKAVLDAIGYQAKAEVFALGFIDHLRVQSDTQL